MTVLTKASSNLLKTRERVSRRGAIGTVTLEESWLFKAISKQGLCGNTGEQKGFESAPLTLKLG
jgi:hypothetical protein